MERKTQSEDGEVWTLPRTAAATLVLMSATACTPVPHPGLGTFPNCPVPVLLSRVNRVKTSQPAPTKETGSLDGFTARAGVTLSSEAHQESEIVGTETDLETGEKTDLYVTYHVINQDIDTKEASELTKQVRRIVPTDEDVRASDIVVDDLHAYVDLNVHPTGGQGAQAVGARNALVDIKAHKVRVK